jgi:Flp pilus assembly protein TadG
MRTHMTKRSNRRRGATALELALTGPLLLLLLVGAADFSRVFYHAVTLANAAGTAAFYGARNVTHSGDTSGMTTAATTDAKDLTSITVTPNRFCRCPNSNNNVDCITGSCPASYTPRVYVSVQAKETFRPLVRYPGVPTDFTVGRTAYMRAQ